MLIGLSKALRSLEQGEGRGNGYPKETMGSKLSFFFSFRSFAVLRGRLDIEKLQLTKLPTSACEVGSV